MYAVSTPEFESSAFGDPVQMLRVLPIAFIAWYVPRHLNRRAVEGERKLIFEESAVRTVEVLHLSE